MERAVGIVAATRVSRGFIGVVPDAAPMLTPTSRSAPNRLERAARSHALAAAAQPARWADQG
jgi:hypothetical protein